jgi:hypothetical protein
VKVLDQVHRFHADPQNHADLKGVHPFEFVFPWISFSSVSLFNLESSILQGELCGSDGEPGCPSEILRVFCPIHILEKIESLNGSSDLASVLTHIPVGENHPFKGRPSIRQTLPIGLFSDPDGSDRPYPGNDHAFFILIVPKIHALFLPYFNIFVD